MVSPLSDIEKQKRQFSFIIGDLVYQVVWLDLIPAYKVRIDGWHYTMQNNEVNNV
jgi:hypothetical protein